MLLYKLTSPGVARLYGIDDNVAVEQHVFVQSIPVRSG